MLQRFDHIILRLRQWDILRNQAAHLVATQNDFLPLVGFLLAHNGGDHLRRELTIREKLTHPNGLCEGRCGLVQVDFVHHGSLAIFVEIG